MKEKPVRKGPISCECIGRTFQKGETTETTNRSQSLRGLRAEADWIAEAQTVFYVSGQTILPGVMMESRNTMYGFVEARRILFIIRSGP